ncbi:MAG: tetratricopeptide repeat protein [Taibaiella sp.]|nr:tetratricopeptide repeat protein [Taibaiella sp.]
MLRAQLQGRALLDSLLKEEIKYADDTQKVKLIDTISIVYHSISPDSGIIYGNIGLRMSEKLQFELGKAKAHNALGLNYEAKTQNPAALDNYYKALSIFEVLKDKARIAATLGNIGNVYASQKKYAQAIENDSLALVMYEKIKDIQGFRGQVRNLGNMAYVYQSMGNFSKAKEYFIMARENARKYNLNDEVAKNLGNLAALNYLNKNELNLADAINYCRQAIEIYESLDDKMGLASNYGNMGEFYLAIATDSENNIKKGAFAAMGNAALINTAIEYLNKGIKVSRQISFSEGLIGCHEQLWKAYTLKKDYKNGLENCRVFFSLRDSVYSSANAINFANLETRRAKKEKEDQVIKNNLIESNNKKDKLIYTSGIILLLIVIGIVAKYFVSELKSNKVMATERKKHIDRIKAQKTVLKDIAYIQSHEVRGPVSTILGLVQLFNFEDLTDPANGELMEGVATVAGRLDKIVTEVVNKENKISKEDIESDQADNI